MGYQIIQRWILLVVDAVEAAFDKMPFWCYVISWSLILALPIPLAWLLFTFLLGIQNPIIRPVALWGYIITFFVLAAAKDATESGEQKTSAIDKALAGG